MIIIYERIEKKLFLVSNFIIYFLTIFIMKKIIFLSMLLLSISSINITNWYYNFWDIFQNCSTTKEIYKTPQDLSKYIYIDTTKNVFLYETNWWDYYLNISWNNTKIWNKKDYWDIISFSISSNLKDYILRIKDTSDNPDSIAYVYTNWKMEKIKNWIENFDDNWNLYYLERNYNFWDNYQAQSCIFDWIEKKCYDFEIDNLIKSWNHIAYTYQEYEWDIIKITVNLDWKDVYSYSGKYSLWDFNISEKWDYALMLYSDENNWNINSSFEYKVILNWKEITEQNNKNIENVIGWNFEENKMLEDFWNIDRATHQFPTFYFEKNKDWNYDLYYVIRKWLKDYFVDYSCSWVKSTWLYNIWINYEDYTYVWDVEKENTWTFLDNGCNIWKKYVSKWYKYIWLFPYINWKMSSNVVENNENRQYFSPWSVTMLKIKQEQEQLAKQIRDLKKKTWVLVFWKVWNILNGELGTPYLLYLNYSPDYTENNLNTFKSFSNRWETSYQVGNGLPSDLNNWIYNDYLTYNWIEVNMWKYKSFDNPIISNNWKSITFNAYQVDWKNQLTKNSYSCGFNWDLSITTKNTTYTNTSVNNNVVINKYKLSQKENDIIEKFTNKAASLSQDKRDLIISKIDILLKKYKEWSKNYEILNALKNSIKMSDSLKSFIETLPY